VPCPRSWTRNTETVLSVFVCVKTLFG